MPLEVWRPWRNMLNSQEFNDAFSVQREDGRSELALAARTPEWEGGTPAWEGGTRVWGGTPALALACAPARVPCGSGLRSAS
jgi:hypothetical protein